MSLNTYSIKATPFYKREKLIKTKEVEKWFYDVTDSAGEPWGRYASKEDALEQVHWLEDYDSSN